MVLPRGSYRLVKSHRDYDKWTFSGFEMGDCEIVSENDNFMVLKEAGHSYWWANHEPWKYAPAEYRVFEKVAHPNPNGSDGFVIREILPSWPVRKQK